MIGRVILGSFRTFVDRFSALHPGAEVNLRDVMPGMVPPALRSVVVDDELETLAVDDSYSLDSAASVDERENDTEVSSKSGPGLAPS